MALCLAWFRFKELADKHNCEAVATVRCQADIKTADTRFKYGGCLQVGAHGHEHIPVPAEVRVVDTTGRSTPSPARSRLHYLKGTRLAMPLVSQSQRAA
jgi:hypothetical protein